MKKIIILIVIAICFSASAQSAFYRKCSQRKDIAKVAYFKKEKIDDIKVDITLVQAKDSASFRRILSEYGLKHSEDSRPRLMICIRNNENPQLPQPRTGGRVRLKGACLIGASESELTVYVFHNLRNEHRLKTILQYIIEGRDEYRRVDPK